MYDNGLALDSALRRATYQLLDQLKAMITNYNPFSKGESWSMLVSRQSKVLGLTLIVLTLPKDVAGALDLIWPYLEGLVIIELDEDGKQYSSEKCSNAKEVWLSNMAFTNDETALQDSESLKSRSGLLCRDKEWNRRIRRTDWILLASVNL